MPQFIYQLVWCGLLAWLSTIMFVLVCSTASVIRAELTIYHRNARTLRLGLKLLAMLLAGLLGLIFAMLANPIVTSIVVLVTSGGVIQMHRTGFRSINDWADIWGVTTPTYVWHVPPSDPHGWGE